MLLHAAPPVCCIPGMLLRTLLVFSLAGFAASCEEPPPPVPAPFGQVFLSNTSKVQTRAPVFASKA